MTTIARYTKKFARYLRNTRAVSALEYAILVGVIAVAIAAALGAFSGRSQRRWKTIGGDVGGLTGAGKPETRHHHHLNKVCRSSAPGGGAVPASLPYHTPCMYC